jgi:hypothetical protein
VTRVPLLDDSNAGHSIVAAEALRAETVLRPDVGFETPARMCFRWSEGTEDAPTRRLRPMTSASRAPPPRAAGPRPDGRRGRLSDRPGVHLRLILVEWVGLPPAPRADARYAAHAPARERCREPVPGFSPPWQERQRRSITGRPIPAYRAGRSPPNDRSVKTNKDLH